MKLHSLYFELTQAWVRPALFAAVVGALVVCAYAGGKESAQGGAVSLESVRSSAASGSAAGRGPSANIGQEIRLVGTGIPANASVEFTAFANSTFSVGPVNVDARNVTVKVPAESVTGMIRIITPEGGASKTQRLQVVPVIDSLTPAAAAAGGRLLIDGTGFGPDAKVYFKGVTQPVVPTIVSPVRIDIVIPNAAKSGPIVVTTAGGKSRPAKLAIGSASQPVPPAAAKPTSN